MHADTIADLAAGIRADRLRAARTHRRARQARTRHVEPRGIPSRPSLRVVAREVLAFGLIEAGLKLLTVPDHRARPVRRAPLDGQAPGAGPRTPVGPDSGPPAEVGIGGGSYRRVTDDDRS